MLNAPWFAPTKYRHFAIRLGSTGALEGKDGAIKGCCRKFTGINFAAHWGNSEVG
jgi:hypothetical protein